MRPAGSPGTAGRNYRSAPAQRTGVTGIPAKPPDALGGLSAGARALPVPRTEPTATKEQTVDETVDVDATTEVAG